MRAALALAILVAACGDDGGGGGADADPLAPDGGGGGGGDGGGGGGADAGGQTFPSCYQSCSTGADCGYGTAINDSDNYECRAGACVFIGCRSTTECTTTFMTDQVACGTVPNNATPLCLHTCTTPADCATGSAAFDADNYRCSGNLCEFIGCTGDPECASALGADYGCHAFAGWIYPVCTKRCGAPADCVVAGAGTLYDADNYACDAGFCRFIGCHGDGECQDSLMMADQICR